jgi:RNase H-fold protein (predicted Holliday junction resolvase)
MLILPFVLVDERYSTLEALAPMYDGGTSRARREALRDGASAVVILHRVLDDPRASGLSRLRRDVARDAAREI